MKKYLEDKIAYYTRQLNNRTRTFIKSCKRTDRDSVIQIQAMLDTYNQVLEELNKKAELI